MSAWETPGVIEAFHRLIAEKPLLRYQDVAQRINGLFGCNLTKNACIGFGRRVGVPQRNPARPNQAGRKLKHRRPRAAKLKLAPRPKPPKPRQLEKTLLENLGPRDCRWPFGDRAPFLFCGDNILDGCMYCLKHAQISYPALSRQAYGHTVT